jgi:hypothetical protein
VEEEEYEPEMEDTPGTFFSPLFILIRLAEAVANTISWDTVCAVCAVWWLVDPTEEELTDKALSVLPRSQAIEGLLRFNAMKYVFFALLPASLPALW